MRDSKLVMDAVMNGETPPRIGLFDNIWSDTLRDWIKQGYPTDGVNDDGEPKPVSPVDHFGFDKASVGGWFDAMPHRNASVILEETDEWQVKRNGAGAALKYWKNKSGTPEHVDFLMTSREVWERDYREYVVRPDPDRVNIEGAREGLAKRREQGYWTYFGHLFIFELMRQSLGDICMYESLLLDPEWIHDYNRVYTDFFKAHYKILFEEAGLPDGVWMCEDLGYSKGLFASPKTLEELIFPYYRELIEFFHSYGVKVVLHACGGIEDALKMIVEAGFDALHPLQVAAGCNLLRVAENYGDKLALIGGFDKTILESGDRERIRNEIIRLINGMKERGGRYVFASDHSISTNVKYDDFCFALDVYRKNMVI